MAKYIKILCVADDYDGNYDLIEQSITDWEEISDSDFDFLNQNIHLLSIWDLKNKLHYNGGLYYKLMLFVKDDDLTEICIETIKTKIEEKIKEQEKRIEKQAQEEKKREEKKREKELKLLEKLKEKYNG